MPKLTLNTSVKARKRFAKLIDQYEDSFTEGLTPPHFRNLCYAHQVLQQYYKIDIDERLEELEQFAAQGGFTRARKKGEQSEQK